MKKFSFLLLITLIVLSLFSILHFYNLNKIYPKKQEILKISSFLKGKSFNIRSHSDIIYLQNYIVLNTKNGANKSYTKAINVNCLIDEQKGACFDRSLLLQKILLLNNIKIRPIYVFFNPFKSQTTFIDFFKTATNSHNVFEYYYDKRWYVLETNGIQKKPLVLDDYLKVYFLDKNVMFIRHLNNRNGYMIEPKWIPDIY